MDIIKLTTDEMAEGLRLLRELEHTHALFHVAETDYQRSIGHLVTIHAVPGGYGMRDWSLGFEPMGDENG